MAKMYRKKSHLVEDMSKVSGLSKSRLSELPVQVLEYVFFANYKNSGISLTEQMAPTFEMCEHSPATLKSHFIRCLSDKQYLTNQLVNIDMRFKLQLFEERMKMKRKWRAEKAAIKLAFEVLGLDRMKEVGEKGFTKIRASDGRIYFLTLDGIYDHKKRLLCLIYPHDFSDFEKNVPKHDKLVFNFITLTTNMREISSPCEPSRLLELFYPNETEPASKSGISGIVMAALAALASRAMTAV